MNFDPNQPQMFFSLSIREGQKKKVTVSDLPFLAITNASLNIPLDTTSFLSKPTRLFVHCQAHTHSSDQTEDNNNQIQKMPICIATLIPQSNEQCCLDFKIYQSETAEFEVTGPYQIDIIGYYSIPKLENNNSDSDREIMRKISMLYEREEEEEEEEMVNTTDLEADINKQHENEQ